jgi:OOP family OmpA-OmpF porin
VSALGTAFGQSNISGGDLRVDPSVKRAAWLPRLGDLFGALKTPGVDLSLTGDAIKLGGWLSAADRQALTDRLRGILGAGAKIESLGDPAEEAARAANDKALSALRAIGTSGVSPDALVNAMNLAVINFSTGSADIAPDSLEVIRKSADAIRRAPEGSKVEIGGHTDNTGSPASNLTLSQARADAVKTALANAGVPPGMLTTKGYGDTKPRATNDTEFGRFQNRRIEFTVVR